MRFWWSRKVLTKINWRRLSLCDSDTLILRDCVAALNSSQRPYIQNIHSLRISFMENKNLIIETWFYSDWTILMLTNHLLIKTVMRISAPYRIQQSKIYLFFRYFIKAQLFLLTNPNTKIMMRTTTKNCQ